jgi:hypothetical protein
MSAIGGLTAALPPMAINDRTSPESLKGARSGLSCAAREIRPSNDERLLSDEAMPAFVL